MRFGDFWWGWVIFQDVVGNVNRSLMRFGDLDQIGWFISMRLGNTERGLMRFGECWWYIRMRLTKVERSLMTFGDFFRLGDSLGWGLEVLREVWWGLGISVHVECLIRMFWGNVERGLRKSVRLEELDIGWGEWMKILMKCCVKFVEVKMNKVG